MMKKQFIAGTLGVMLVAGALTACSETDEPNNNAENAAITINNCGVETTFNEHPKKAVSMGVTGLAYLFAAGAQDSIIGRANEWGEEPPAWIGSKADSIDVLSDESISMEALLKLEPDLVYGGGFSSENSRAPRQSQLKAFLRSLTRQNAPTSTRINQKMSPSTRSWQK